MAVIIGGVWYFKRGHADAPDYQTATVARGDLTQVVTATGTLNPVVNVTVGSQVSGRISKLNVDFNSMVKSNEVIAEIDPSTYQAAVEQSTADLANAKANLELQQVEAKRSAELFTNKLISGSDYDTAIANLHEAEATVQIKQASLDNAMVNLGYCKILFAGGRRRDFARSGPRPDGGLQLQHADPFSNRERPDKNADRFERGGGGCRRHRGRAGRGFHGGRLSLSKFSRRGHAGAQFADDRE